MKIIKARISIGGKWEQNTVYATFTDGSEKMLFKYFPDELSFSEDEFLGLTEDEAHDLFHKKDIEYLRS